VGGCGHGLQQQGLGGQQQGLGGQHLGGQQGGGEISAQPRLLSTLTPQQIPLVTPLTMQLMPWQISLAPQSRGQQRPGTSIILWEASFHLVKRPQGPWGAVSPYYMP